MFNTDFADQESHSILLKKLVSQESGSTYPPIKNSNPQVPGGPVHPASLTDFIL